MERMKKYIWGCVLGVVMAAILIGVFYYCHNVRGTNQVSEGTLIWQQIPMWERIDTDVFGK